MRALRRIGHRGVGELGKLCVGVSEQDRSFQGVGLDDPAWIREEPVEHGDGNRHLPSIELKPRNHQSDMPADLGQLRCGQILEDCLFVAREHLRPGWRLPSRRASTARMCTIGSGNAMASHSSPARSGWLWTCCATAFD